MKVRIEKEMEGFKDIELLKKDILSRISIYEDNARTIIHGIAENSRRLMDTIHANEWTDAYAKVILDMALQLERVLELYIPKNGEDGLF